MATTIDLTKIKGRTELGYTQGLPLGISIVDTTGKIAPILTDVAPSSALLTSGLTYFDAGNDTLYVHNGTAWKSLLLS